MVASVVVPFHKGLSFLKDCLDSLKDQVFKDFEVILILDRPEEGIEEICKEYNSILDLKVFALKGKEGVAAARNMGLENASGKYIFFLDSDDYLIEETIGNFIQTAQKNAAELVYAKKRNTWYKRSVFLEIETQENNEYEDNNEIENEEPERMKDSKRLVSEINLETDTEEVIKGKKKNTAARLLLTKRRDMQSISVLNILFDREWINKNAMHFCEDLIYYSDMPFLAEALFKAENVEFIEQELYVKRRHNDPINMPSLSQMKDDKNFNDCILSYEYAIESINPGSDIRIRLDQKMIHYYTAIIAPMIRKTDTKLWREKRFGIMKLIAEGMSVDVIHSVSRYKRKMIKLLKRNDLQKTMKAVAKHNGIRMFFYLLRRPIELKKFVYRHYFVKKPLLNNYVLFESFFGKSYSDSPKYIYEYLSETYPNKYKYVWVMNKKKKDIPYESTQVKRFSFRYFHFLARSKYIVFNSRQPKYFIKRKGNIFLETWHGTPLKKLVFDMEEVTSASPQYKEQFYVQSRSWDYLIAANYFSSEIFKRAFMYDKRMLEYGYPRNDILHRQGKEKQAEKIRKRLNIPMNKKTILYAPTWRDDEYYESGKYRFDLKLNLNLLRKELGNDYAILLRTHYFIADQLDISGMEGFAYNLSKYDDIAELYLISDMLITDYSSVFFDYANLKRPMLFYTYDLEKYRDVLRGFYIDMEEELPGPLLFTTEEVADAICNIDDIQEEYKGKYHTFYEKFCGLEDGHASENVVKEVFMLPAAADRS